jgi:hypothetical protein
MLKPPRKIKKVSVIQKPKAKRRVLRAAQHHLVRGAVKKKAVTLNLSVPSVVSGLSVLLKPQNQELIPETATIKPTAKPQTVRQPLVTSIIIRQKTNLKILPKAANAFKLAALTLVCIILGVPALSAFEAHIVNVTAQLKEITPPTLSTDPPDPSGGIITWDKPYGGSGFATGTPLIISMTDAYPGATNIYYTFKTGTLDPSTVPDPICGQPAGPNSGGGAGAQSLTISASSAVKAIACDGATAGSNSSFINIKTYSFDDPLPALVINEFLPHPSGGDAGLGGGHLSGNGGEWVELFNNSTSTIDVTNFLLADINNNFLYVTAANTTGSLAMAPGGFVVVYRDGDPNFELDTATSGAVSLFDTSNFPIDSYNYSGPVVEGKSIARVPDASPVWFDPCPTPGQPNVNVECPNLPAVDTDSTTTVDSTLNTTSTPDSTTTPDTSSNTGGGSGGRGVSGPTDQNSGPSGATTTPDSNATSTITSDPTATPDNSTSTVSSDPSSDTPPDQSNTPPPADPFTPPINPTSDSSDSSKQQDAVTTSQQDQPQAIVPAPTSGGDGTPPPPPDAGSDANSSPQ